MILMVSGRTDIINYYNEWFINRLKSGFVDVRNPINPNLVSRIFFADVDLIVICTKNPLPIIPYLKDIKIPILMQITLILIGLVLAMAMLNVLKRFMMKQFV